MPPPQADAYSEGDEPRQGFPVTGSEVFLIRNPAAGGRRGREIWPIMQAAFRQAQLPVVEAVAEAPQHAWALAERAARDGYGIVAAAGGDGTIHEVVNGLLRGRPDGPPALAIIPVGTANIFVHELDLPRDPGRVVELLRRGARRRIDLGRVNDRFFTTVAGTGFDAEVVHRAHRWPRWLGGKPRHVLAGLQTLPGYRPVGAWLRMNGEERRISLYFLAAAITGWYGGGIHIAPHAQVDDGYLSIVYGEDMTAREAFTALRWAISGRHLRHPKIGTALAEEIRVETDEPLAIHADGEAVGRGPAAFRCIPGGLEVIVPAGN
jgi:diacylglycerol kinase (ATP)